MTLKQLCPCSTQLPSEGAELQPPKAVGVPQHHPAVLAVAGTAPASLRSLGASEQAALVRAAVTPEGSGEQGWLCVPMDCLAHCPDTFPTRAALSGLQALGCAGRGAAYYKGLVVGLIFFLISSFFLFFFYFISSLWVSF